MYEMLPKQCGFNGVEFWFIGDTSSYGGACPVECYTSEQKALAAIEKHNKKAIL
jgi:hypothetical protein